MLTGSKSGCKRIASSSPPPRQYAFTEFHQQCWGVFSPESNILLGKTPIKVVKEAKFLGFIFDTKLTFKNHVQYIKSSCQKAPDILRVVEHIDWGADRIVLPRLYRALVRSKWDYGSIAYGSARRSVLKHLDPIHHQGLRIALGAFRTSPAQSPHVETHEPSLTSRRLKLSLNYDKFENFMDLIEDGKEIVFVWAVSYTHLTLPTSVAV